MKRVKGGEAFFYKQWVKDCCKIYDYYSKNGIIRLFCFQSNNHKLKKKHLFDKAQWHNVTYVTYGQLYVYMQGHPVDIQTPTHWYLISHTLTILLPVLLPSTTFLPHSSHCTFFPTTKNLACVSKILCSFFFFFFFFKIALSLK